MQSVIIFFSQIFFHYSEFLELFFLLIFFLGTCRNLQQLWLRNCALTEIPFNLCTCDSLVSLDLSLNKLVTLPDSFCHLTNLRELLLNGNKLCSLPLTLVRVRAVKKKIMTALFRNFGISGFFSPVTFFLFNVFFGGF